MQICIAFNIELVKTIKGRSRIYDISSKITGINSGYIYRFRYFHNLCCKSKQCINKVHKKLFLSPLYKAQVCIAAPLPFLSSLPTPHV